MRSRSARSSRCSCAFVDNFGWVIGAIAGAVAYVVLMKRAGRT